MQQVAKLHDPAGQKGQHNLSIDYMIDHGDWDTDTKPQLCGLRDKMLPFGKKMKLPRNKLLAHNDVSTIMTATELGQFDAGEDTEYFKNLKRFAEIVHEVVLGEHFLYDDVQNDIDIFMIAFDRGRVGGDAMSA